ncbi:sugar phosphate isomerase/epimerase family protein [Neolewinella persica]|uniref:sugar phosphate isomerase/epimerase family protein n=1 Tax=Neolewinella persica TaxID=70998 RepID=UPI00037D6395|nr:sugar phosphate isomerase/epimerase [Neolewinella persica]
MKHVFPFLLLLLLSSCGQDATSTETTEAPEVAAPEADADFGGLALYTLRDTISGNVAGVLQHVADLGYKYVEAAGYADGKFYGMTPTEFKGTLEKAGLQPMSSHQGGATPENIDQMIADVKAAGFTYFVLPVPPMGAFSFDPKTNTLSMNQAPDMVMKNINMIAQKCAEAGLQCLYHNHDFEFVADENGIVPIDYFIENSNPEHLNFQMDLYWVTKAGADPLAYFDKAPGRWKGWHVKDMDDQGRFAPVGEGNIDFKRILAAREKAGMEFYLVEQDRCFNHTALEAIAISHKGLKEIGFE